MMAQYRTFQSAALGKEHLRLYGDDTASLTFCFHLSFSLSLFISTFPFLKVWLTGASGRRVHFRFLWLWLPQLGDMTDGRDRGNGPLSIHLPSSSNFGPGGKTPNTRFATLYCQIHAPKFKIQQKHCVHGWHPSQPCHSCLPQTPAPEVKWANLLTKWSENALVWNNPIYHLEEFHLVQISPETQAWRFPHICRR